MKVSGFLKCIEEHNEEFKYLFKKNKIEVGTLEMYFLGSECIISVFECIEDIEVEDFILNFALKIAEQNAADYITVKTNDKNKVFLRKGFKQRKIMFSLKNGACRNNKVIDFNFNRRKIAPVFEYIKYI